MPQLEPIHVQVTQMHGPAASKRGRDVGVMRDFVLVETDFPIGKQPKKAIEGLAQAVSNTGTDSIGP
jgi:hypothetical protein